VLPPALENRVCAEPFSRWSPWVQNSGSVLKILKQDRAFATPYFALASQFVRFIRKPLMGNILC
jgi:hypothetical protein